MSAVWLAAERAASCDVRQTCCCASICSVAAADAPLDQLALAATELASNWTGQSVVILSKLYENVTLHCYYRDSPNSQLEALCGSW